MLLSRLSNAKKLVGIRYHMSGKISAPSKTTRKTQMRSIEMSALLPRKHATSLAKLLLQKRIFRTQAVANYC